MSFFIKVPYNPLKALCTTPLLPTPAQPSLTFIVQHQFSSSYKQSSGFHNSSYNSHSGRDSFNCGLLKKNNTKNFNSGNSSYHGKSGPNNSNWQQHN